MPAFTNGQWVLFDNVVPGAHTSGGGTVGIFLRGGVDGLGQTHTDRVMAVGPDGQNLPVIVAGTITNVELAPADAVNLRPLPDASHVPAARRATLNPDAAFTP